MKRSNLALPVYTGDVSGACSALFELGGMVVIHDPSGCNSTYNTHDETRWYDHDSLIFITGLVERDAILGNDQKLVDDVVDAALELRPRFIALCNSPIPFISGTDFVALCRLIERRCGIPCFYVRTNGMHDYTVGAGNAFAEIAKRFVVPSHARANALNLLGATPLDFAEPDAVERLRGFCDEFGFEVASCWAMESDLLELTRAAEASVNLVVSVTGLCAAHVLRERFGTPYVVGTPMGSFAKPLARAVRAAMATGECAWPCRDLRTADADGTVCVVGEPVAASSMAASMERDEGVHARVLCPLEVPSEVLGAGDAYVSSEEEVVDALAQAKLVVADAFYASACPPDAQLRPWPHFAFSGRQCFAQRHEAYFSQTGFM